MGTTGPGVPGAHIAYRDPPPARIAASLALRVLADLKTLLETGDVPATG